MLRVAHSIFSRRPHAAQLVYVPGRRGGRATRAEAGREGLFMRDLRSSLRPAEGGGQPRGAGYISRTPPRRTYAAAARRPRPAAKPPITAGAPKGRTSQPATRLPSGIPPRNANP